MRFLYDSICASSARETSAKRSVAGVEMGDMADLVDEHRAAGAARRGPALYVRREHEVVEDELLAAIEQVAQACLALRTLEDVVLLDSDHRLPATLGG
jgi:hypothetical protein